jgi:hypothetical protein
MSVTTGILFSLRIVFGLPLDCTSPRTCAGRAGAWLFKSDIPKENIASIVEEMFPIRIFPRPAPMAVTEAIRVVVDHERHSPPSIGMKPGGSLVVTSSSAFPSMKYVGSTIRWLCLSPSGGSSCQTAQSTPSSRFRPLRQPPPRV